MRAAVVVVSSKIAGGQAEDRGREAFLALMQSHGIEVDPYLCVPDEREGVAETLLRLCDDEMLPLVFTVGGTGVRPTDWVPEVTQGIVEKEIPGVGEAMRAESLNSMRTAMLSRGTAGIRGRTLIVNLPGSPGGARDNALVILPLVDHMVEKISSGFKGGA